ncbi:DNA topoisomerase 3-beta-1 [Homalodisca vitripennis]|nr:DNA topoisomerase 3-beta-1 [Homalodisca vitripennis]
MKKSQIAILVFLAYNAGFTNSDAPALKGIELLRAIILRELMVSGSKATDLGSELKTVQAGQLLCGKCRRYMKYIQAKPARLHCSHCDETYNLPQNGNVRLYKELKCPLDDFELLSWSTGVRGKSFPLCPYCYNHPPFREMKKGSGCNSCTHPTCPHSLNSNGLSSCVECEGGVLVLDPASAPRWKLGCNRCDVIIHLFDDAAKVSVEENICDCGAQTVSVEYKPEKSKLPNEATEMSGCVFCSPQFSTLVEKHRAVASKPVTAGRGRGGRGRSRGKPRPPKDKMAQLAAYFV